MKISKKLPFTMNERELDALKELIRCLQVIWHVNCIINVLTFLNLYNSELYFEYIKRL